MTVAGKPVMSYVLDELKNWATSSRSCTHGHLKKRSRIRAGRVDVPSFHRAKVQDGTAGAMRSPNPTSTSPSQIFVDTIFDADLTKVKSVTPTGYWVKKWRTTRLRRRCDRQGWQHAKIIESEDADLEAREHRTLLIRN